MDSKIDLPSLIDLDIRKAVIHEVPGITRCFLSTQKDGSVHLKTEGINILVDNFFYNLYNIFIFDFAIFHLWTPKWRFYGYVDILGFYMQILIVVVSL